MERPFGIQKLGDFLYFGSNDGVSKINLKDLGSTPEIITTSKTGSGISGLKIIDEYLYYSIWGDENEVWRLKLDETEDPEFVVGNFGSPSGLTHYQNSLFIADITNGKVVQVELDEEPFVKTELISSIPGANHLFVQEDTLYIGQFYTGTISKLDLTSSSASSLTVIYDHTSEVTGIYAKDNKVLFGNYNGSNILEFCPEVITAIENFSLIEATLFPNPASDFIRIEEIHSGAKYSILSIQGELIRSGKYTNERIDIKPLIPGQYIIHLPEESMYAKFLKF